MANIKLGTDTLTGVNKIRVRNADVDGQYVEFPLPTPAQEKAVSITANGTTEVTPDSGKTLSKVTIATNVPSGASIPGGYDVTFSAGGQDYSIVSIVAGNAISEPIPPQVAGIVTGWATDEAGQNLVAFPYTPTASTTLYAKISAASTVLNDNSWETISAISAAGTGANYWSVGDAKTITLSGTVGTVSLNADYNVYIIGFNHNSDKEGTGISFGGFETTDATHKQLCLVDSSYNSYTSSATVFTMNTSNTNSGGWKNCKMRKTILGSTDVANGDATSAAITNPASGTLMAAFPADLRAVLKPITKYTNNVGNSSAASAISPTVDYLPLLSEYEVFKSHAYANSNEDTYQAQYQYYANGKSKVKYQHSSKSNTAYWWLRSPNASNSAGFCNVSTDGAVDYASAHRSYGVAPAFLV